MPSIFDAESARRLTSIRDASPHLLAGMKEYNVGTSPDRRDLDDIQLDTGW